MIDYIILLYSYVFHIPLMGVIKNENTTDNMYIVVRRIGHGLFINAGLV